MGFLCVLPYLPPSKHLYGVNSPVGVSDQVTSIYLSWSQVALQCLSTARQGQVKCKEHVSLHCT